jgi:hypothetical protein
MPKLYTNFDSQVKAILPTHLITKEEVYDQIDEILIGQFKRPVEVAIIDQDLHKYLAAYPATQYEFNSNFSVFSILNLHSDYNEPLFDGIIPKIGDRLLLSIQSTDPDEYIGNGIWELVSKENIEDNGEPTKRWNWIFNRAKDFDNDTEIWQGLLVYVKDGAKYKNTLWELVTSNPTLPDEDNPERVIFFEKYINRLATKEEVTDAIDEAIYGEFKRPVKLILTGDLLVDFGAAVGSHDTDIHIDSPYETILISSLQLANFPALFDDVDINIGDRVLWNVNKDSGQLAISVNGIYEITEKYEIVKDSGIYTIALKRSKDFDENSEICQGLKVHVKEGTKYKNTIWTLTTQDPKLTTVDEPNNELLFEKGIVQNTGSGSGLQRYTHTITSTDTDGTNSSFTINHNLDDEYVSVTIYNKTTQQIAYFEVSVVDKDNITISTDSAVAIQGKEFIVQIIGLPGSTY